MLLMHSHRDSVHPCGALIFVMASGFNCKACGSHTDGGCPFTVTCGSCILSYDMKGNRSELFKTTGGVQNSPVQICVAWCFTGDRRICKKTQRCLSQDSSARYLGAAEEIKLHKISPKAYECKGFLTWKLNFWVDKIHATLTDIQWQEIVKGVRFSILILGTVWQ